MSAATFREEEELTPDCGPTSVFSNLRSNEVPAQVTVNYYYFYISIYINI